jgi:hypothetical protein
MCSQHGIGGRYIEGAIPPAPPVYPYHISGELDPDCSGNLQEDGNYNGRMSYKVVGKSFYHWWESNSETYWISTIKGSTPLGAWGGDNPIITGWYPAEGQFHGMAEVSEGSA